MVDQRAVMMIFLLELNSGEQLAEWMVIVLEHTMVAKMGCLKVAAMDCMWEGLMVDLMETTKDIETASCSVSNLVADLGVLRAVGKANMMAW